MAKLTERQVKEQDIDWYCLINDQPTHIASMGGMIPWIFRDRDELRIRQEMVASLGYVTDARLNMENIQRMVDNGYEYLQDELISDAIYKANLNNPGFAYLDGYNLPIRLFASTFVEKARRGFRSFARLESNEGNEYLLIAEPVKSVCSVEIRELLRLTELPCDLKDKGGRVVICSKET